MLITQTILLFIMDHSNKQFPVPSIMNRNRNVVHYERYKEFIEREGITNHGEGFKKYYLHIKNKETPAFCRTIMTQIHQRLEKDQIHISKMDKDQVMYNIKREKKEYATTHPEFCTEAQLLTYARNGDNSLQGLSTKMILIIDYFCELTAREKYKLKRMDLFKEDDCFYVNHPKIHPSDVDWKYPIPFYLNDVPIGQIIQDYLDAYDKHFSQDPNRDQRYLFPSISQNGTFCNRHMTINDFDTIKNEIISSIRLPEAISHPTRREHPRTQYNDFIKWNAIRKVAGNNPKEQCVPIPTNELKHSSDPIFHQIFSNCSFHNLSVSITYDNRTVEEYIVNNN